MLLISGKMDSSIQDVLVLLGFNPFFTVTTYGDHLKTRASTGRNAAQGSLLSKISVGTFLSDTMGKVTSNK